MEMDDKFHPNMALQQILGQAEAFLLCVFACLLEVSIAFCVDLNAEMDECARVNRFPRLSSKRRGFDFGFGSLNDTEYMCRTKFHIKIIQCVKERCEATFRSSSGPEFMKVMWSHTLNTRRSERAAAYICRQHNLRIENN
ncbi:unnamed protein product [Mesocestoides corti]|uniref:Uncharacterized protein n=1 Tax=Mesocestoides corti TaxID=53468 RepID=A0A0R3U799_MESCO|nr:unnamed protein product [Mesocestoides corti]